MERLAVSLFAGAVACIVSLHVSSVDAAAEAVVYSFCSQSGCTDGALPAGLIYVKGTFYGTTYSGGQYSCPPIGGCGTVFSIDRKTGAEKVIYSFCSQSGCTDGATPEAGVIAVNGTLYGTTYGGGANCGASGGCGTVFSVDPTTGAETVLYSFCSKADCADGEEPEATLTAVKGLLYGTTYGGGANCQTSGGCGTVFSIDPATGAETVLYSFCGQQNCTDGDGPVAGLIAVKRTLYGTTLIGGANDGGTVFSLDPNTGTEKVLYAFCSQANCTDGEYPNAAPISVSGTLYGITSTGGNPCHDGCGTVFSVDPATGAETVIYAFCSQSKCKDGSGPVGMIDVDGTLYGTTYYGGDSCVPGYCCLNIGGCGTVFSLDLTTAAEAVLHSFCSEADCKDGTRPETGLIDAKGVLYGTTFWGGANYQGADCFDAGCGTVFSIKP